MTHSFVNGQLRGGYFKELLERIRDIRASEKVFYRQVLDIYATSIDYDPHAEISKEFFKKSAEQDLLRHTRLNGCRNHL